MYVYISTSVFETSITSRSWHERRISKVLIRWYYSLYPTLLDQGIKLREESGNREVLFLPFFVNVLYIILYFVYGMSMYLEPKNGDWFHFWSILWLYVCPDLSHLGYIQTVFVSDLTTCTYRDIETSIRPWSPSIKGNFDLSVCVSCFLEKSYYFLS